MKAIKLEIGYPTLFLLVLLPRLLNINTFITWDEPKWTYRSIRFLTVLLRGDFRGTLLKYLIRSRCCGFQRGQS